MPQTPYDRLREWDHAHLWHPFTALADWAAADPLIIERAHGVYLYDTEGRRYLDGVSSLWCNVHGHRHPALDAALLAQLEKVAHTTLLGASHPAAIELARKLVERAPPGLTRVFFSDNGATAVEVALKMAFQYWRQKADPEPARTLFVCLDDAYHGDTLGDVSVGGVERFHSLFAPLLFPVLRAPAPHCYRCPLGLARPDCAIACLGAVEQLLKEHAGHVAAVVVEPLVQGAAGMIVHPEGYLRGLSAVCKTYDTLLIADEVAVGMGRTGTLFACAQEDVTPDFLCLAKGLTGGYLPLAATLTTEAVAAAFNATTAAGRTFYHGHTYSGNPLGAAVALANLQVFDDEATLAELEPKAARLADRLREFAALDHVGDVRQRGLLAGVELVADKSARRPYPSSLLVGARVCARARTRGLLIRPLGDVLVIMPPLAVRRDELDEMLDVMLECARYVTEGPLD
jgi:adenosylmethionine-8-amino-7-oxononanoate aminotransferase